MIQPETQLLTADNTGAKQLNVIRLKGGSFRRYARIGDIVTVSIRDAIPNSKVEKGKIFQIIISDLDEIPNLEKINFLGGEDGHLTIRPVYLICEQALNQILFSGSKSTCS